MRTHRALGLTAATVCVACSQDVAVADSVGVGTTAAAATTTSEGTGTGTTTLGQNETTADPSSSTTSASGGAIYDVGAGPQGEDTGQPVDRCNVGNDLDGFGACDVGPFAPSFDAEIQWQWGENGASSLSTPMVANLTDDNNDGAVDLCDTPDIVLTVRYPVDMMKPVPEAQVEMLAFDGATGEIHWSVQGDFSYTSAPALGDIDGDGLVEIVTIEGNHLAAYSNLGVLEWAGNDAPELFVSGTSIGIGLADLDADGDVEILAGRAIVDHLGNVLHTVGAGGDFAGFAVDLDDDGDLEYVHSAGASHHDGTNYFTVPGEQQGHPQVADIDDDGLPEIIYSAFTGISIYEHDGALKLSNELADLAGLAAAIHDLDGDGAADIGVGHMSFGPADAMPAFSVLDFDGDALTARWSNPTQGGCCSSGTAFDFLGDATAESLFADDSHVYVYDAAGVALTSIPRGSPTAYDFPVVADVDNDGSAEIVVSVEAPGSPAIMVIRDANDGWVPARRIWNQHAYHVTNVREDGTIPQHQPKNWEHLNTFRTQAQRGESGVCNPEPPG